ncbi:MAG: polysaccharide biosynthesis/export family protein, partial [Tannerellaceae bacterium]
MRILTFALVIVMLCSCSAKKITYFKDIDTMHQSASNSANEYEAVIKKDDLLAIVVSCSDPTAALPL